MTDAPIRLRLLHGLGADRRAFQRFMRLLPSSWDIEALDLLGHGDAPKPAHGYSLRDHAAHIAAVLDAEAAGPFVVAGHSYGAATGVALAAVRPDLVAQLVMLDPVARIAPTLEDSVGTKRMIAAKRAGTLPSTVAAMYPEASDALRAWTVETWERMAIGVVDEFDLDWMTYAEAVTCPVAIIHGELEHGGGGDLSADWFDDPQVTCIPGAGHYLHATHAREVAAALVAAVAGVARD